MAQYIVSARKYRPDSFGTLIGQDNIAQTLKNSILRGQLAHAYLFCGPRGVGKTTLLTLLCGLKKPSVGTIETDGQHPFDRQPSFLSEQYYLSDEVAAMNMTAAGYAVTYGRFWMNFDMNKFLELMELFGNDPHQMMDNISFGQLKKTYIAFALACNTKYLFMDEPTNGLDIPSKSQFRKAMTRYTREDAVIVISTHQVRDLENLIDPIIILERRNVLLNASIAEISDKLYFDYGSEKHPDALYSEMIPGSNIQVLLNQSGEESKVNIEALFNTVHQNRELIKGIFKSKM